MFTISIDPVLFDNFPMLTVGGFIATHIERAGVSLDQRDLEAAWVDAREALLRRQITIDNVANLSIVQDWRRAFSTCGAKPSTFKSSVEAMVRRTLRDGHVSTPLPWVTFYCALSTRYLAPLGAYDLDRLPAMTVALRPARPASDSFDPIGARAADLPLDPRFPVYAIGNVVACFLFNHRDSKQTCLTPATTRALFVGEAVTTEQQRALADALDAMRGHLAARGAATTAIGYASAAQPETDLANIVTSSAELS